MPHRLYDGAVCFCDKGCKCSRAGVPIICCARVEARADLSPYTEVFYNMPCLRSILDHLNPGEYERIFGRNLAQLAVRKTWGGSGLMCLIARH